VGRLRAGAAGPLFLEVAAYRWKEHVGPGDDWQLGYRARAEAEPWIASDPVARLAAALDPGVRGEIEREIEAEVADAFAFAERSPFPGPAELWTHVFREAR
jgi:TPP-dependent pyruvate/acetoin dehydrogenase alpha subunit